MENIELESNPERLDDFVYKFRGIGQELGITKNEQLQYFKCSVPLHLYLYHKDATTIKEAMENIKRACALGRVSVVAPVEIRTTQSAPFMQMIDSPDSSNEPRKSDHVKIAGLKFQGKVEYICHASARLPASQSGKESVVLFHLLSLLKLL